MSLRCTLILTKSKLVDSSSLQSLCSPGWLGVMPLWSKGTLLRLTPALLQRGLGSALLLPWFPATAVRGASLEPPISLAARPGLCNAVVLLLLSGEKVHSLIS